MYLILTAFLFFSCSFKDEPAIVDKSLALKKMDSDGDQVSDFDEISRGTNRYVANLTIEKPKFKSLYLDVKYKFDKDETLRFMSKKFNELSLSDYQQQLISESHHRHGNILVNQLLRPHKDSFKVNLKDSEKMSLKIDSSKVVEKEHIIKSIVLSGELKSLNVGSIYELFIGNRYIGAITKKNFQINANVKDFIKLVDSGEDFFLRVANFNIGKKKYTDLKRAILKKSRLISINDKDKRVEYFISKKIDTLDKALAEIFSKTKKVNGEKIMRLGTQVENESSKFVVSSVGNPFKKLSSEVRISLIGNKSPYIKSESDWSFSSSSFEKLQKLGVIDRNSSLKILIRVNKKTGGWYNRKYFDYTRRNCPRTRCLGSEGNIRCSFELLTPTTVKSQLLLTPYSIRGLEHFYFDINNKRYRLIDLIKDKLANFKIINSKEALIVFQGFETLFDGDETSELNFISKGESKVFWEGLRVSRYQGRVTCLQATRDLLIRNKAKLAPISVGYKFLKDTLKIPASRIGRKLTARISRNVGYSYELQGGIND